MVGMGKPALMPDHNVFNAPRHAVVTLPNIISFARLCAVPLAIWLVLRENFEPAFFLFIAAGLSDLLDGWLARRQGGTVLGAALDPLADKTLIIGMYVTRWQQWGEPAGLAGDPGGVPRHADRGGRGAALDDRSRHPYRPDLRLPS